MPADQSLLDEVALTPEEYQLIVQRLGREPNTVELGMFGSLWSEHCGYKNSKPLLGLLPTEGEQVLVRAGQENAGVVDIGDGFAIAMKIESHNHPSAIEPYQGAATGVGGILRDIFTMGARPIALLNSLRFGPLDEARNRYILGGVVAGIAGYGNCLGIPNVGGEVAFEPGYEDNPLVNALCVGLLSQGRITRATAAGPGNLLMLVGADTGRDGIHGASGLASRTFEEHPELRSAVQVGNPFLEKQLLEACMELVQTDWLVGLQDLGAAGLTSATVESAARAGTGVEIDVSAVPRRATGMTPYEVMLSESQERMLVVVRRGCEEHVRTLFDNFGLHSAIVGQVIAEPLARIKEGEHVVAEVPVKLLTDPPQYRRHGVIDPQIELLQELDLSQIPDAPPKPKGGRQKAEDAGAAVGGYGIWPRGESTGAWGGTLLTLLAAPNIASKRSVFRQYDHQVLTNTVVGPGGDAAVLRIKGTPKGVALTTDGNGRWVYLNPFVGGAMAVAEAARNVVCVGARPVALTDCLNFGNPERAEVYYQLEQAIRGMAEACRVLKIPVISGNVSLYNETAGHAIYPTPVVGALGILEDVARHITPGFKTEGDFVYLIGPLGDHAGSLAGSEYLAACHDLVAGKPAIDLDMEARVQVACLEAMERGLIRSAHDCSHGGLAVALAECCVMAREALPEPQETSTAGLGFVAAPWPQPTRVDALLFGEASSRIVLTVRPENTGALEAVLRGVPVPFTPLGVVGGDRLVAGPWIDIPVADLEEAWSYGLEWAQQPRRHT